MKRKIEFSKYEDDVIPHIWKWQILEWNEDAECWIIIQNGMKVGFDYAAEEAKKVFDSYK